MRWGDVSLSGGSALLHETKNGERRSIPIKGRALDVLREYALSQSRRDDERVFPDPFPRKAWNRALEASEVVDFHWHDLRHTTASYLAQAGLSLQEIGAILGHKSPMVTARYAHLVQSDIHNKVAVVMEEKLG